MGGLVALTPALCYNTSNTHLEDTMTIRNIGVFTHVDAGKTTLSEQLLMHSGAIRRIGSVDAGTAHTDNLPVEQRRGISVKATCVSMDWRGATINLIDTPGHVDFAAEVERSLWALDAAVMVVCAVEGVQPHTETLFQALKEQGIDAYLIGTIIESGEKVILE